MFQSDVSETPNFFDPRIYARLSESARTTLRMLMWRLSWPKTLDVSINWHLGCHAFSRMQWNIGQQWSCGLCHPSLLNLDMLFWWHLMFFDQKEWAPCEAYQRYPFNTLSVWIWNLLSQIQLYSAICKQIQVFTENRRNPKLATPHPYLSCGAAAIKVILGSLGQPMQP